MPELDPRLKRRFQELESDNKHLRDEINTLKANGGQGGNKVQRGVRTMLRMSTIGHIQNRHLYFPSSKGSPDIVNKHLFFTTKKVRLF